MSIGFLLAVLSLAGWRGETVNFRPAADVKIGAAPAGVTVREGVLREVRYVTKPHGTEYASAADRVEWNARDAQAPRIAQVVIAPDAKPGVYAMGDVELLVVDRVLPPPRQWKYFTGGMWHNPWSIARLTKTEPWSEAHLNECRKFLGMTAAIGSRVIMTTLSDLPWNHQCYDANLTMVRHVKHEGTGEWTFDYSVFDKWVSLSLETGNGPQISCYSLIPWGYEVYWEDETGHPNRLVAKPGTKEFADYWGPFLKDFERHLRATGWVDQTVLAFDERSAEDVNAILKFLDDEKITLKTAAAHNEESGKFSSVRVSVYSQILNESLDDAFCAMAKKRYEEGKGPTVYYTCCFPEKPNTFIWSDPDDAFWLAVMPIAKGLQGYSRWTFDSWPKDPMKDASYYWWNAGDTYFAYPDGSPSVRYLMLQNGVQNGEKWRILRDAGENAAELEALAKEYDIPSALKKKDGDFTELIARTLKVLNQGKIEIKTANSSCMIDPLGARIVSWKVNGREMLWTRGGPPSDGGIPICWPWFGTPPPGFAEKHGFARKFRFDCVRRERTADGAARMVLRLESSPATRAVWAHDFRLEYEIELGDAGLNLRLKTTNLGKEPFAYTAGFHPYFAAKDLPIEPGDRVSRVTGIDRLLADAEGRARARVLSPFAKKLVIWNPGPADESWREFLCIEPVSDFNPSAPQLDPGAASDFAARLEALDSMAGGSGTTDRLTSDIVRGGL